MVVCGDVWWFWWFAVICGAVVCLLVIPISDSTAGKLFRVL